MRWGSRAILLLALSLCLTACGAPPEASPAPGGAVTETVPDVAAPPVEEPAADLLLSEGLTAGDTLCLAVEREDIVLRAEKRQV